MSMWKQKALIALAVAGFVVGFAHLKVYGAEIRTLTLDEALNITLENNRDIQKAQEYRRKVMGIYVENRSYAMPNMTVSAIGGRSWDQAMSNAQSKTIVGTMYNNSGSVISHLVIPMSIPPDGVDKSIGITLTQPLFTWGQIGAAIKAAKFGIASAEDQLRTFRQAALKDVSAAFYDVLLAKEFYKITLQNFEQKTAHLTQAKRKFSAGVATEFDVLAAQVTAENARPDVIKSENTIRIARERLRFLLGIKDEVDAEGRLEASDADIPDFDESIGMALKKRPELADIKNRVGFAGELVKVTQAGDKPRVDLKATGGYRELTASHEDYDGKTWSVGIAVTFPFFDGFRTKGRVTQAKSDVSTLKIEEAKAIDSIALQVRDATNQANESAEILKALSGTVTQAERLLQMAEKGYEFGVKTRLDVDDAELNVSASRGNLAKAKRDSLVARVNLDYARGTLGEEYKK
jgi:outer membrane protein TolC